LGEQRRNVARPFAQQRRSRPHDLTALCRHEIAPDLEATLCSSEREVEIAPAGMRDPADLLSGCRVANRKRPPVDRVPPLATKKKLSVKVSHRVNSRRRDLLT
jgi:hypothetical protein